LEIDPNHINAAYARGACENKRGNFDKAIEDYHMALEKDTERPTSPKQRISAVQNRMTYQEDSTRRFMENTRNIDNSFKTFDQNDRSGMGENFKPTYSESPMNVGRDLSGISNKNVLLSPGGQLNSVNNRVRREDSMNSNMIPPFSKQNSDNSQYDRSNPMFRLSKNSSISSSTTHLQNTPHEETKSNMSIPNTPSYSHTASPSNASAYKMLKKEAEYLHSEGYAARKNGDYNAAIMFYTKALDVLPTHFKALFNRGFAYDKIGEYDKAIKDYTKAIEIDPQNAFTYYNKGISLDRKGEYDEAIWFFTKAIELEPKKADFFHNRGFAYRKKKDYEKAIEDYS
jgi:tetratricopeptide (TPR) repeat protein